MIKNIYKWHRIFRLLQLVIIFNALFVETLLIKVWIGLFMVFNATFINISVISWRSVLLVGETGVPTCRESLTNLVTYRVHERELNSQL